MLRQVRTDIREGVFDASVETGVSGAKLIGIVLTLTRSVRESGVPHKRFLPERVLCSLSGGLIAIKPCDLPNPLVVHNTVRGDSGYHSENKGRIGQRWEPCQQKSLAVRSVLFSRWTFTRFRQREVGRNYRQAAIGRATRAGYPPPVKSSLATPVILRGNEALREQGLAEWNDVKSECSSDESVLRIREQVVGSDRYRRDTAK